MKTSIATVSLSGDLAEKLAVTAAAGFGAVEIFENDFLAFDHGPREVGRMVRDAGLEISLFQLFRDFEGLPEPQRARAFDRARRKFETMNELGTDLILICSTVSPLALGGIDRAAQDLAELGEIAATAGVRIGYEALAWGRYVSDHRDAWEIVRRADHPQVGLILDSFHSLARGIDSASVPLAYPELYSALETGTVDGQENPLSNIVNAKFTEVQKYLTLTGHQYNPQVVLVSKTFWDKLDADEQALLAEAATEARDYQRKVSRDANAGFLADIKASGMEVTELTPEQLEGFRAAVQPVVAQFRDPIGGETVDAVAAELKRLRGTQ